MKKSKARRSSRPHQELLAEVKRYRESGMTAAAYAASQNVNVKTLQGWVYRTERREREQAERGTKSVAFVPLLSNPTNSSNEQVRGSRQQTPGVCHGFSSETETVSPTPFDVEIQRPSGLVVRIAKVVNVATIASLVRALDASC